MAYGITKKEQIIDKATIIKGCEALRLAASDFEKAGTTVIDAGEQCTDKVISVNDLSFGPNIVSLGESIKEVKKIIVDYANNIEQVATEIYQQQSTELNTYKEQQKKEKEEENKKKKND